MPQYIWEGIFSILNVLVPGIILALFVAHYQNRRKREIQIEGKLAVERINGYEIILNCLYRGQSLHEVSLKEEGYAKSILTYFDTQTFNYQCPDAFKSEEDFDLFYKELNEKAKYYQIYLDDKTNRQLHLSIGIYTRLKLWLDAFCDTEHSSELKMDKDVAKNHIDWMYKITGMLMFSHCTRAYAQFDSVVCKEIANFSLTYRKHKIRRLFRHIGESIIHILDIGSNKKGIIGKFCQLFLMLYIGKDGRDMIRIMDTVVQIMKYIHFSDRFTPQEYFTMRRIPDEDEQELFGKIYLSMLHRS